MAKWGEGDPRWIVEEREDAKNVNNWHWSEKNGTQWSKDYVKKLLVGLILENDECFTEITDISKMEGEAIANNRKSKVIVFFEWELELEWKGYIKQNDDKTEYKGKIEVPNLSEEYKASELDFTVSVEKITKNGDKLKEFIRLEGTKILREKFAKYIEDLRIDFSKDLILPTKKVNPLASGESSQINVKKQQMNVVVGEKKINTKSCTTFAEVKMEEEFFCTPNDLCQVLLNKDLVGAFSRSTASVNAEVGGEFNMFGGSITGKFEEIAVPTKIRMKWRHKSWPDDCFSDVSLEFTATDNGTTLKLYQAHVPSTELVTTQQGWSQNYFHAIKMTFGYGGRMF